MLHHSITQVMREREITMQWQETRSFWSAWHAIAHARPHLLQKAQFIKSLLFSLMQHYANLSWSSL